MGGTGKFGKHFLGMNGTQPVLKKTSGQKTFHCKGEKNDKWAKDSLA